MITCPRCGAENKDDAPVCRMCATPLDAAAAAPARPAAPAMSDMPATVLIPSPGSPSLDAPGGRAPAGKAICPACGATNDADWAFCQQCGSRLSAQAPSAAPAPQWSAPTVVTPPPPLPPTAPPPAVPQQAPWGAQTVISPTPDFSQPPPGPPQVQQPPAQSWGAPTVITPAPDLSQYAVPQPPAAQQPPPQSAPPAPPPAQTWGAETVVTPSPDFGQVVPPPAPAWGAATVVTPPQLHQPPPPSVADNIPTVLNPPPPEPSAYLDTIVDPDQRPPSHPGGTTGFSTDDVPTAGVPQVAAEPSYVTTPTATPTAGIGQPLQPSGAPPPDQHTIVMSSTPVASPPKSGRLLLIMEGGDVGETFQLRPTETGIGRVDGDIKFPHDGYMSSRHARILQRNGRFFLIDNNSRNGTFVKIHQEVELHGGDVVLIGKQLFRFEADE